MLDEFGNPAEATGDYHDPYACCHDHYPPEMRSVLERAARHIAGEHLHLQCSCLADARRLLREPVHA